MDNSKYKYQEIAATISAAIESGEYPVGSKLPAHRVLAKELQTTAVTVAKAYQYLVEQRQVESFVGRGSYVLPERLKNVINAEPLSNAINFSILQPCMSLSINTLNRQISQQFQSLSNARLFAYSENSGLVAHRISGARWCQNFGLAVPDPEQIILTNGAQNALASLIQLYSKEGDYIALEAQTYPGLLAICKHLRRKVLPIKMDGQGMLPEDLTTQCLAHKPSMVVIVPSQQNPTGATMGSARRESIATVIKVQKIWLIEDDIYAFLNNQPLSPISNLIPERAFYISSLSKAISPGLRCGYIKCPVEQHSVLADFIRATLWLASPFMFEIASELINSKQAFMLAQAQCDMAKTRQVLVTQYLAQVTEVCIDRQPFSYSCWLHLPDHLSAKKFTEMAQEKSVIVSDASHFSTQKSINAVRLSIMSPASEAELVEGLKIIAQLLT
ncbi:MAG: PLP-dependent aminotransferase family protein [Oceanospirillaceae bacterium]|nr:PLP-dependent aminotransferase family protein [Oceanospirillaceae bacterium]